ncbi:cytochrome oxidase assembly protein [Duganella sp. FT92W]|uniref:Cytochrome oxidase assembly protein n=1 Tax=Pseudoduganella rivuli TaxID=2666085 RepID=A0A7X2IJD5_9BURK|nr:FixH family protein [Pseudoduganella rivuli]MRV70944.1 cytochrome oxidase assembly protein [Pseudoduganella rivuli]
MDTSPWWTQRWPWLLMLGPFIVLLAGSYTGWLAFSRPDALVVGDYYKRGKAINQDLRRDRAASELGISAVLRYDAARGILTGKIDSNNAMPATVVLRLAHATQPAKDVVLEVHPAPDGVFGAALPMLERTRWQVLVESDKRDWRLEGRWHWPVQREVTLSAPGT